MSETPDREIRVWKQAVEDVLRAAINVADRASDHMQGGDGVVLFHEAARAIGRLMDTDPAFKALKTASVRSHLGPSS